jgi:hypothetical protein
MNGLYELHPDFECLTLTIKFKIFTRELAERDERYKDIYSSVVDMAF